MMSLKAQLIDNKMEDESISDKMLAITVGQAKQAIKDKSFIKMIYTNINEGNLSPDRKLTKVEFTTFARVFATKMSDFEANELFTFLIRKERTGPEFETASF
jgi:hypothetical protein